ncbi:MAG TPA: UdgX family uracil-DNA binding protein [Opitutaceae bacterium]|jgi:DNA polymerase
MPSIAGGSFKTLEAARATARRCRACPLFERATQAVFGEGPRSARILFVGEQPGDREDLEGRPFVGPAGRILEAALTAAGLSRKSVYLTNVVKHFKWEPARKRRLHMKPNASEVAACRPWLETEIALVEPEIVVALGATAAQALMGRDFRVTTDRGRRFDVPWADSFVATVHPSSVLRAPPKDRKKQEAAFRRDVAKAARLLKPASG